MCASSADDRAGWVQSIQVKFYNFLLFIGENNKFGNFFF